MKALAAGLCSSDAVLNPLSRQQLPAPTLSILTPDALRIRHAPVADCAHYDTPRSKDHGATSGS